MASIYNRSFKNKWLGQPATAAGVVPATAGLAQVPTRVAFMRVLNRAAAASVGLVGLLKDAAVTVGTWVASTTTFTDVTAAAQNPTPNDVVLETGIANDGFIVGAKSPFGAISVDVTTAGAGTTPAAAHAIEYWNGTAWVAMLAADMVVDVPRAGDWAVGEQIVVFDPPADWVPGGSGSGVSQTQYNVRITKTAIPTIGLVSALARRIYVGELYLSAVGVATGGYIECFVDEAFVTSNNVVALGFITSIANAGNALQLVVE